MGFFRPGPARAETAIFDTRADAGRALGQALTPMAMSDPVVLALPRGGVPVAAEVARALAAPLDVLVVRKLGVPWNPELAFGAVGEGGVSVINETLAERLGIDQVEIRQIEESASKEVRRRVERYRGAGAASDVAGRTVIIVDDGIATGATVQAAIALLQQRGVDRIVVAAPVAAADSVQGLRRLADDVVVLSEPPDFRAVGLHYRDFSQLEDDEVTQILRAYADRDPGTRGPIRAHPPVMAKEEVTIPAAGVTLFGTFHCPRRPAGVVVFVHGSGSSRLSPRNMAVARTLQEAGMATLLFDLLTVEEAAAPSRAPVFNIELLCERLLAATKWLADERLADLGRERRAVPIGYFGASTGAAAALQASVLSQVSIASVVSRGGRPDLAAPYLSRVTAPTLLIVGARDRQVLELNRQAADLLNCPHELSIVSGATHLFAEPGALEEVGRRAAQWFADCFAAAAPPQVARTPGTYDS